MSSLSLLRHPFARITGARGKWVPVLAWALLAVFVALLARRTDHAVESALARGFGAVSMPLLVFAVFGLVCPEGTLAGAARPLVFLGAPARRAAFAVASTVVGVSALVCAALAALVVVIAHGPTDPPLGADLLASSVVGALGGAAYAAYFSFGSSLFGTAGRGIFLVADLVLGGLGVGALVSPRAHVRALFGGPLAAHVSLRGSSIALAVMLVVFVLLATLRSRQKR